ncbi:MAG: radical SAM protein [Pseudomonadota bacterium]|nr:radical SAM protein [Pseudomonadota bacterium]
MLDLLLTHAYFLAGDPHEAQIMRPFPPLGLQYLVAHLRQNEFPATDWWDATFHPGPGAFAGVLADADPRVLGFYGHTITRPITRGMVALAVQQGRRVVAGGPDPSQYLDAYFDMGVEVVVIGEGEITLAALMAHLRANGWAWEWDTLVNVDGIAFRAPDGAVVRTAARALIKKLDTLLWPHRERRDLDAYFGAWRARHGETAMSLTTSRGCPYHCTWCSKQVYGDTFRRRDPDAVIDELLYVKERFEPDQVWFVDDMFTINRAWVHRFCDRVVARGAVTPFYLIGRPETLDAPMVDALRRAGCYRMYLSAESGAQHVLDAMRKETTVVDIERGGALLRGAGIEIGVFVMIGYPGEEKPDILATRDMLRRLDPAVTLLSVAHPMKGTQFYDQVQDRVTGEHGGRLTFEMRYSPRLYEMAQRMIWADLGLRKAIKDGSPREILRNAMRWPVYRAAFAALE